MNRTITIFRTTQFAAFLALAAGAMLAGADPAAAAMTPQQCYARDSQCTQFCGQVKDADWRHECFMRCNIYLDNCLSSGVWTDQGAALDSSGGGTPTPGVRPKISVPLAPKATFQQQ